jgi:hypothetical protein
MISLGLACSTEGPYGPYDNIVSDEEIVQFEELILLINLKISDSAYLVVKSIDSISLYVNGNYWTKVSSDTIDTSLIETYSYENMSITQQKINYFVAAEQDIEEISFTTAGDFAQYINNIYELYPGEYACFIESFQITLNDGTIKVFRPLKYEIFKIEENTKSAYVGEIEIYIP